MSLKPPTPGTPGFNDWRDLADAVDAAGVLGAGCAAEPKARQDVVKTMFERYGLQEGLHGGWRRYTLTSFRLAVSEVEAATLGLNMPLPCDIKVGGCTMRKGVRLGTLVLRMEALHKAAFGDEAQAIKLLRKVATVTNPDGEINRFLSDHDKLVSMLGGRSDDA